MPMPMKPRPVRKADKPDAVAIYNATGKLVGICDPDDIKPVGQMTTADTPDMTPMPPGDVGVPADDVAKQRRAAALRKGLYGGGTAAEQNDLADGLNRAAIAAFTLIRTARPTAC